MIQAREVIEVAEIICTIRIRRTVTPTANKKLEDFFGESLVWVNSNIKEKLPQDASMDNPVYEVHP